MKNLVLPSAFSAAACVAEAAKMNGLTALNPGSFTVPDMAHLIQATKEQKPLNLHHWMNDQGQLCVSGLWYRENEEPKFVSLYAHE